MAEDRQIILFHYSYSPYARRIIWYLNLRGIPYSQCVQPPTLPRPDVKAIGTVYRRIPILSIGKDIYNDTRLIIKKLEEFYPSQPKISATTPEEQAIERLLDHWAIDSGLFTRAAQLIPADLPFSKDPKVAKDRQDFSGGKWANAEKMRPEALVEMRSSFELLETTLLKDGRDWVLKTKSPSLSDIEAVWPFHWLSTLPGALPPGFICPQTFPKAFAWIKRFDTVVRAAAKNAGKPTTLKGDDAMKQISASGFAEAEGEVDSNDPTGLKKGQVVEVWPTDTGFNHKDKGSLVALSGSEIVIESKTQDGKVVRVHTPRHGFRLRSVEGAGSKI